MVPGVIYILISIMNGKPVNIVCVVLLCFFHATLIPLIDSSNYELTVAVMLS